jgi:hypothetical protein
MPLKPGDPGYNYETGTTSKPDNVVTVGSKPAPSGGGRGSTVGTPQQRQAPRLAPAQNYEIGGSFYYHPSLGKGTMTGVWGDKRAGGARRHEGQDIRMPMNTPLVAVTSGTVTHYKNSSAGTVVYLNGDDGNKYSYFHLNSRVAKNGQRVQAGQIIAYSGNSGNSTAPHLHFEYWNQGRKVDPRPFLSHTQSPGNVDPTRGGDPYFADPTTDGAQTAKGGGPKLDLFGNQQAGPDIAGIFDSIDWSDPNRPYGEWVGQLRDVQLQEQLAALGLAQEPRKIKAHALLRSTLGGMSAMVRRDGYRSKFPGDTGGGENVVRVSEEEEA